MQPLIDKYESSPLPGLLEATRSTAQRTGRELTDAANTWLLAKLEPWEVALAAAAAALLLAWAVGAALAARRAWQDKGWKQVMSGFLLDLPGVRAVVRREQAKVAEKIRQDLLSKKKASATGAALAALPGKGTPAAEVRRLLLDKAREDVAFGDGEGAGSRVSGTVYMAGAEHKALLNEAHALFSLANPMHADVFPSCRRMEAEVVAMTAALLGGARSGGRGMGWVGLLD